MLQLQSIRNSGDGNWKTNTHLGGSAETCPITNELEDICLKAKNAVHLVKLLVLILMESNDKGLVVHEINNTTEFRNVVRVTGVDIPKLMLEYVQGLSIKWMNIWRLQGTQFKTLEKALRIYTPSLNEKALADFLADRCDDLGFRDIHQDEVGNLDSYMKGSGEPKIMLMWTHGRCSREDQS